MSLGLYKKNEGSIPRRRYREQDTTDSLETVTEILQTSLTCNPRDRFPVSKSLITGATIFFLIYNKDLFSIPSFLSDPFGAPLVLSLLSLLEGTGKLLPLL